MGKHLIENDLINRINKRISGELHDNVSSKLSIIRFKLCNNPHEVLEAIELLDRIIGRVRNISHNLYSPSIEHLNFLEAIQDFLFPLHDVLNVKIFNLHSETQKLNSRTKIFLFRIFQELINNVLSHARASQIIVCLRHTKQVLNLSVYDNGVGFLSQGVEKNGIGLKNINYRARELKAKYKFKTKANKGTLFIISVPTK